MISGKQNLLQLLLIIVFITFTISCKKDKSTPSILGSWIMNIGSGQNIPVQISFYANDFFEWIPLEPTQNLTRIAAEYTYSDGILTIINDPDCPENGIYKISVQGDLLTIILQEDACGPRIAGLTGSWSRKNDLTDMRLQGIWLRNIHLEGKQRAIVFYTQQNGVFEWIISEPTSVYETTNGRYAVGENYLVIFNFLDCGSVLAYYNYLLESENALTVTEVSEPCEIRSAVMTGTWERE